MINKNNLKKGDSKYWTLDSFWKGSVPKKEKANRKRRHCDYWTFDLYGSSARKHSFKN